jgi:hypothetical protein
LWSQKHFLIFSKQTLIMAKTYVCNDADLYLGVESLCTAGETHQVALFSNKTIYTVAYFTQLRADVQVARALPTADINVEKATTARKGLVEQKDELLRLYQNIKSYIESLFTDKKQWKEKYDLAGQSYYTAASKQDWTGLDNLMTKSTSYLEENEAALIAKGGMPADFKTTYAQTVADTRALRSAYLGKKQGVSENNLTKKEANDTLYQKATSLCRDAKKYFATDSTIATKFVWDNILNALGSTTGSTAKQRRKTINNKTKEKTLFDATTLGMTVKDYNKMLADNKKAEKKAKSKRGKKAKTAPQMAAPLVAVPALPAAST